MHPVEINDYVALDRLLDDPAAPDAVARTLRGLDAAFAPPSGRLDAIREAILDAEAALPPVAAGGRRPILPTPGRIAVEGGSPLTDHRRRHPSRRGWLAAAAVVALALGLAGYVYGSGWDGGRSHGASISAPLAALGAPVPGTPNPSECTVAPLPASAFEPYFREASDPNATPRTSLPLDDRTLPANGITVASGPTGPALVGGTPADARTVAEIDRTARELAACDNAGDEPRLLSLVSERAGLRYFYLPPGRPGAVATVNALLLDPATPKPSTAWGTVSQVTEARLLNDGRAVALVHFDAPALIDSESGYIPMIFLLRGDRWIVDDFAAATIPSSGWNTPVAAASAAMQILVTAARCDIAPQTVKELNRLAAEATPLPPGDAGTILGRTVSMSDLAPQVADGRIVLTGGVPASREAGDSLVTMFGGFLACGVQPNFGYPLQFFTDGFIRRGFANPDFVSADALRSMATPGVAAETAPPPEAVISEVRRLGDGRVAVLVRFIQRSGPEATANATPEPGTDGASASDQTAYILTPYGSSWRIDDVVGPARIVAASSPTPATPPASVIGTHAADASAALPIRATPMSSCDVAPRTADELKRLAAEATPRAAGDGGAVMGRTVSIAELGLVGAQDVVTLTGGIAASREEIAGIRGMFNQLVACRGASGIGGALSFYTDDFIRRGFANPDFISRDDLSAMATPGAATAEVAVLPGAEVVQTRRLADGRVSAIVRFAEPPIVAATPMATANPAVDGAIFPGQTVYILKRVGESWRIDGVVGPAQLKDIPSPATPMTSPESMSATATP